MVSAITRPADAVPGVGNINLETTAGWYFKRAAELHVKGRLTEAEDLYRKALQCSPDFADAWNNMGCAQKDLGRFVEAEASLRTALKLNPNHVTARINLAFVCDARGDPIQALNIITGVLTVNDSKAARDIFISCVKRVRITSSHDVLRSVIVRALNAPWTRPADLSRIAADLVKFNPAIRVCLEKAVQCWPGQLDVFSLFGQTGLSELAADPVLSALLDVAPICDIELEKLLAMVRRAMLESAWSDRGQGENTEILAFYGGVARQCFINEYVYALSDEEARCAKELRNRLSEAICEESPIPAIWVIAVSAYYPLHSLSHANRLLERTWPEAVQAVLSMQLSEHIEEVRHSTKIPAITPISDEVSMLVKQQYESNPYPRWIKGAPPGPLLTIDEYISRRFPHAKYQPIGKASEVEILIAGCGTGQHPISKAQTIRGGQVLAIDLSMASLSYARRKAEELNVKNIEFAQGDILELGVIKRRFDVIESVGVLHHMDKPLEGWRMLLSLLRPGGIMRLGIYSEAGRADIVSARELILKGGYGADADSIRRCRQDLIEADKDANGISVIQRRDFFSMSTCRDLLFHVNEHRFCLPKISEFINNNKLQFLGFEVPFDILRNYNQSYPRDIDASNLEQWHIFEKENPNTFRGMYQFWVQKPN